MEQETKKRVRRSKETITQDKIRKLEERVADYEAKIAEAKKEIDELKNSLAPVVKKRDIWSRADELGVSPEEVMKLIEKAGKKKNRD